MTWIPLALTGIRRRTTPSRGVINQTGGVHAATRGAGPVPVLARMAIVVQLEVMALPLLLVPLFLEEAWVGWTWFSGAFGVVAAGASGMLPILVVSAAGIHAWHRVLQELTSRPEALARRPATPAASSRDR